MNKGFIGGLIAGAVTGLAVFAVAPRKLQDERDKPFKNRYFAHRGLYSRDGSVPENSIASFSAAVQAGYGIELDIQLTKDDEIVVFHDEDLKRICGKDGLVIDYTLSEIKELRLLETDEQIPTFAEVLSLVDGKVPLIIEFKGGKRNKVLCNKAMKYLRGVRDSFAVERYDFAAIQGLEELVVTGEQGRNAIELIMAVEEEFDLCIIDEDAERINTVGDLIDYVKAKVEGK